MLERKELKGNKPTESTEFIGTDSWKDILVGGMHRASDIKKDSRLSYKETSLALRIIYYVWL